MTIMWRCSFCKHEYETKEEADACEQRHIKAATTGFIHREKPTLGVYPARLFYQDRAEDLCRAIYERIGTNGDKAIVREWCAELSNVIDLMLGKAMGEPCAAQQAAAKQIELIEANLSALGGMDSASLKALEMAIDMLKRG